MAKLANMKIDGEAYDLLLDESLRRKKAGNKKWAMKHIVCELVIKELREK